jgi:signal transduction histidine kinase/ActR/RegA family two-component response regulator
MSKTLSKLLRDYISPIGLKVAVPTGALLFIATMINLYRQGGWDWVLRYSTNPGFWAAPLLMFAVFVVIMSKVVIWPLKRFELHVKGLKTGEAEGPFSHDVHDELGFLAERFNSLQEIVNEKMELRERQMDVLQRFMGASSGVFDADTLMANFFGTLSTAYGFDLGAYMLARKCHKEGAIFSGLSGVSDERVDAITEIVSRKAAERSSEAAHVSARRLKVTRIDLGRGGAVDNGRELASVEFPLRCFGETIGVVVLLNAKPMAPVVDDVVLGPMLSHLETVLERVLTHVLSREETLEKILAHMHEGVFLVDDSGRMTTWNERGARMAKDVCRRVEEYGGERCECMDCEFHPMIERAVQNPEVASGGALVEEIRSESGRIHQYCVSRLEGGHVVTARDVTDDKLLQKRLLLSSKLAALGEMAAGIAHEVNNPLQVMMGNVEILENMQDRSSEKASERLAGLKDGVLRIKGIIRNLLVFAREQTTETEDVDLNHVITKASDMLRGQLKLSNVRIDLDLDPRISRVKCNTGLLQQVMVNLLQNARDAIEESGTGSRVYIRTNALQSGEVVIEVTDDGPGMSEEVKEKMFDPFFTTKDVGKGTGLGLSISRRIIEGMGGSIDVSSKKGHGASFHITLFPSPKASSAAGVAGGDETSDPLARVGYPDLAHKSVLLVDDEESVASTVRAIVAPFVSSVDTADNGTVALDLIKNRDFDVLLLDIKMPGMDGMEIYRNIRNLKPYMTERIIFVTGDVESEKTKAFLALSNCQYLAKPFESADLLGLMSDEGKETYYDDRA